MDAKSQQKSNILPTTHKANQINSKPKQIEEQSDESSDVVLRKKKNFMQSMLENSKRNKMNKKFIAGSQAVNNSLKITND